jgi:hypothetical protein
MCVYLHHAPRGARPKGQTTSIHCEEKSVEIILSKENRPWQKRACCVLGPEITTPAYFQLLLTGVMLTFSRILQMELTFSLTKIQNHHPWVQLRLTNYVEPPCKVLSAWKKSFSGCSVVQEKSVGIVCHVENVFWRSPYILWSLVTNIAAKANHAALLFWYELHKLGLFMMYAKMCKDANVLREQCSLFLPLPKASPKMERIVRVKLSRLCSFSHWSYRDSLCTWHTSKFLFWLHEEHLCTFWWLYDQLSTFWRLY